MPRRLTATLALACLLSLGACTGGETPDDPDAAGSTKVPPGPAERLGLATGWGPTVDELDRAARQVDRLSLPDLAGQVIVADWAGTSAPVAMMRDLHLGGVIAFSGNVVSAAQIRGVNRTLSQRVRRPWPLWLSVDQEGGTVERVQGDVTRLPAFMSAGAAGDAGLTQQVYAAAGRELRGLGFTVDFAPDADVTIGPSDPAIGSRSAGSDPAAVARQVVAAARGYGSAGVVPVIKHFPGHGSVTADSHVTLPVQTRSRRELEGRDLVPFAAAVKAELPAIMVGHLDVRAVQGGVPSSLSPKVIGGLLRRDLGFDGLVVSDSLEMAAITRGHDSAQSAVALLRAGGDVVLMPPSPARARAGIVSAVRKGRLERSRLEQAAARQVALLLHSEGGRAQARGAAPGSARAASARLSRSAVTMAAGPCGERVVDSAVYPVGDATAIAAFSAAAQAAGLELLVPQSPPSSLTTPRPPPVRAKKEKDKDYAQRRQAWQAAEQRRRAALAQWQADEEARLAAGTSVGLSGYGGGAVSAEVAVATDTPYALGATSAPVRIATYGTTPGAMSALVDVLLGRAEAPGRLPVDVPGVERRGC